VPKQCSIISDIAALVDFGSCQYPFHLQTIWGGVTDIMGQWGCNKCFQPIVIIYGQRWAIVTIVPQS